MTIAPCHRLITVSPLLSCPLLPCRAFYKLLFCSALGEFTAPATSPHPIAIPHIGDHPPHLIRVLPPIRDYKINHRYFQNLPALPRTIRTLVQTHTYITGSFKWPERRSFGPGRNVIKDMRLENSVLLLIFCQHLLDNDIPLGARDRTQNTSHQPWVYWGIQMCARGFTIQGSKGGSHSSIEEQSKPRRQTSWW